MTYDIILEKPRVKEAKSASVIQKYLAFCDSQMNRKTLWFLIPLMTLTAVVMPIGVVVMSSFAWYTLFVGLSMILFFANVIASIAGANTRITITLYLLTILIHVLAPMLSFMITAS